MVSRWRRWYVWLGLLIVPAAGISYGIGYYSARPRLKSVTIHVSGAQGTKVSGAFEVDGVLQAEPEEVELPAQFTRTGHRLGFTVRWVSGPEAPICAVVEVDGVRRGVGTAAGGVRVDVGPEREPRFLAVTVESEWKPGEDIGPRPDLIGLQPPEWTPVEWLNTKPLRLAELRGKVVLVRWFTGPICDDCVATAPALREFHERYHDTGLVVVGMFHHDNITLEEIQEIVNGYGYRFPVAVDRGARTRRLWCLGRSDYGYTSVTFLLDRQGAIRHIHPGGRYVKGDADYQMLAWQIERALASDQP